MDNEINVLIKALPLPLYKILSEHPNLENLLEIVLDYGRPPEARFNDKSEIFSNLITTKRFSSFYQRKSRFFLRKKYLTSEKKVTRLVFG